jgi:hypothetical protein
MLTNEGCDDFVAATIRMDVDKKILSTVAAAVWLFINIDPGHTVAHEQRFSVGSKPTETTGYQICPSCARLIEKWTLKA